MFVSYTYDMMKRFLWAGFVSGMRFKTAASGYDMRIENMSLTDGKTCQSLAQRIASK